MVLPVSSVSASNAAYAASLIAKVRAVPATMLMEATRAAFTAAVQYTHQDSGQAAASWDFGPQPLKGLQPVPEGVLGVGMRGEQRSVNGNAQIVVDAQITRMEVELADLMMDAPVRIYIDTPITGFHAKNAFLAEAYSFAAKAGKEAADQVLQAQNSV